MTGRYEHVLSFALEHPWNVTPAMLQIIASILAERIAGVDHPRAEIEAALVNRKNLPQPKVGSVAVIPIYGVIAPRMNLLSEMSGGTTYQKLSGQLREAMADKTVRTIVLDIDSPGGSVAGNAELASELLKARTKKPIIAQAQYTMASAAYQLGAAATEVVAAPSAQIGSIGTVAIHNDLSEALKSLGVKRTFISAGEGKTAGNDAEPLSEDAHARITDLVSQAYEQFVQNVVRGRGAGMTADRVRREWKAHVYTAADAKAIGMIDEIATLDETLTRLLTSSGDVEDQRAAELLHAPLTDTPQEPPRATGQDRRAEIAWETETERALLELTL